ncbi:MAG: DUF4349 domain-containing protein [Oscillospiraceae bacterium]|nr:DUF4349 domain-containing protein [Oscillospiraceae bacterium]
MKKLTALLLALVMALTLLTACGANSASPALKQTAAMDYAVVEEAAAEAPMAMTTMNGSNALAGAGETGAVSLPESRKWIVTVDMSAETEDLDALLVNLEAAIEEMDGYVEDQNIYNGSSYAARRRRNANLTIRIPAADVDAFATEVSGIANVVSKNVSREDITLTYVATESKVTALKTEEARLLELLAQAETMADLLEIEARLSDVRYELESYSSQLRLYDNQVDYATIYLFIDEVQEYTPVAEKTVWERIRDGFSDSLEGVGDGFVDAAVWILANSPYLVVWGVLLTAAVLLLRTLGKRRSAKKPIKSAPRKEEKPNE